jgi:hypothetical protein
MHIAVREEHLKNADSPIVARQEACSNITVRRFLQYEKHLSFIVCTRDGILIVVKEVQSAKASLSILSNLELGSNIALHKYTHPQKQRSSKRCTLPGTHICCKFLQ